MKRQASFLVMGLAFALTACAGGGGGQNAGGSAMITAPPNDSILMGSTVKEKVKSDLSNLGAGTLAALNDPDGIDMGSGYSLHKGSLVIKKDGIPVARFETGEGGDVDLTEDGYVVVRSSAPKELVQRAVEDFLEDAEGSTHTEMSSTGTRYTVTRTYPNLGLVMNNTAVELEYSTFGMWAINYNSKGTWTSKSGESGPVDVWGAWADPFFDGVEAKKKAPAANATFSGKAVALAHIGGDIDEATLQPVNQWISGNANLTVAANGKAVDLALVFPDYYDIEFSGIAMQGNGAFASGSAGGTVLVRENATHDPTKFSMDTASIKSPSKVTGYTEGTYIEGQFFGDTAGQASEATGKFQVADKNYHNITGAFGVKK